MNLGSILKKSSALAKLLPDRVPWSPTAFMIAVTTKCNLRCTMCSRTINDRESMHMSRELFLKAAANFKNKAITILGHGEPFVHPDIFKFIEMCQNQNASVNLVTNGMLLSAGKALQLLEYSNVRSLAFSIDGINENYNKIRVNGNFLTVIRNLMDFSVIKRIRGLTYPLLTVNFVGMNSNIDDLPKLIDILGHSVDAVEVIHPIIYSPEMAQEHLNTNIEHAENILRESAIIAGRQGIKLIMRDLIPWSDRCIEPWFAPYIGVRGDVYPCHLIGGGDPEVAVTDYYDGIAISRDILGNLCGNIGDSSFSEIWNNIKFQQFRHKLSQINHFNFGKDYDIVREQSGQFLTSYCIACPYRWHCGC